MGNVHDVNLMKHLEASRGSLHRADAPNVRPRLESLRTEQTATVSPTEGGYHRAGLSRLAVQEKAPWLPGAAQLSALMPDKPSALMPGQPSALKPAQPSALKPAQPETGRSKRQTVGVASTTDVHIRSLRSMKRKRMKTH